MMKGPYRLEWDQTTSFAEGREFTKEKARTQRGVVCPCCDQYYKLYKKPCHSEMALFLIMLVKAWKRHMRFYTTRELFPKDHKATTEGVLLRHWGLIEVLGVNNTAGAPAGAYRPTDRGLQFVHGVITISSHVHLLNNQPVGFSDKQITIRKALGSKFNYEELMAG